MRQTVESTAAEPQWPPRSPHEALLGTPGGRERLRRLAERGSPSPSPTKLRASRNTGSIRTRDTDFEDEIGDLDDDDDEETLQLKLQEIQARLKLKKLQKTQRRADASSDLENESVPRAKSATGSHRFEGSQRPQPQTQPPIEVPASPVRRTQATNENIQRSPSRVLLGIDKGLKGKDVSLKRAPSSRRPPDTRVGLELEGSRTPSSGRASSSQENHRPLSFSERLASARSEEISRKDKQERIQKLRSTAFGVGQNETEEYRAKAVELPNVPMKAPSYSRDEILGVGNKPKTGGYLQRSKTAPDVRHRPMSQEPSSEADNPFHSQSLDGDMNGQKEGGEGEASFEPYSGLHLSKRILPHNVVTRQIAGKKTYLVQDLLRQVKAPDFSLPDVESDIVVFAIVAEKSEPQFHKPVADSEGKKKVNQPSERSKFMVVTLADLEYEIGLYLFSTGFTRFYKLPIGTVVAILNPEIMPPPRGREDTGKFSLVINSDGDTILEIGNARDMGWCESVRRDGKRCNSWVNTRKTKHCEFHTNEALRRARTARNEVNQLSFGFGSKYKKSKVIVDLEPGSREHRLYNGKPPLEGHYDAETQSRYFIAGSGGANHASSASLIDGGMADRAEREEGLKRRIAAKEKEREIARKLGEMGGGAGREYMRRGGGGGGGGGGDRIPASSSASSMSSLRPHEPPPPPPSSQQRALDAKAALGLLSRPRDAQVHLSPVKRKRSESAQSGSTATSAAGGRTGGFGWGGNLKDKLARMKDGESLRPSSAASRVATTTATGGADVGGQPVRKKTRFVTEKGIREAGRESLGGAELPPPPGGGSGGSDSAEEKKRKRSMMAARAVALDDDDDDEDLLVIV
ncbi:uncharacterized protein E0L32_011841 [Thyridium curvatum]|uniref:Uncharacterized protein n=1 Tax=Thyridium curvatum TaxID=1093900 RepID=A0A507BLJ5_9PEZI|nr:uncharacterized protein E0L32_011841 [Thyridium curvatum]TPX18071.1 hypothetical protein E0L32_011841 [Thyridium curvatum]